MTLECPSYKIQQIYTCQQAVSGGDGCCAVGHGGWGACCDIGCCSCQDDELQGGMRVSTSGRRWMRPHPTESNRDAHGKRVDLHSNKPQRVPRLINYQRAPCYEMNGTEHFNRDVCDCHPAPSTSPDEETNRCEDGELVGEIVRGMFPDCTAHTGHEFKGPIDWMWCRAVEKHDEADVRLSAGPLLPTLFARTDQQTPHTDSTCAPNALTWCTQIARDSPCREPWCNNSDVCYYQDNPAGRRLWDEVRMDWGAGDDADFPRLIDEAFIGDPAILDLKNAAIRKALTVAFPDGSPLGIRLDRLDAQVDDLSRWARGYNSEGVTACEDLVTVTRLPGSFFVHTHEPANVDLVVTRAFAQLHLVPYQIDVAPAGHTGDNRTLPYARVNIEVGCRARLRLADGSCVLLPSRGVGPIIFEDAERRRVNTIPRKAEWWGFLGHSSDPKIENVEAETPLDGEAKCCQLAADLSTVVVPGWPAMAGSYPEKPNKLYTGRVRLDFRSENWESFCNAS